MKKKKEKNQNEKENIIEPFHLSLTYWIYACDRRITRSDKSLQKKLAKSNFHETEDCGTYGAICDHLRCCTSDI